MTGSLSNAAMASSTVASGSPSLDPPARYDELNAEREGVSSVQLSAGFDGGVEPMAQRRSNRFEERSEPAPEERPQRSSGRAGTKQQRRVRVVAMERCHGCQRLEWNAELHEVSVGQSHSCCTHERDLGGSEITGDEQAHTLSGEVDLFPERCPRSIGVALPSSCRTSNLRELAAAPGEQCLVQTQVGAQRLVAVHLEQCVRLDEQVGNALRSVGEDERLRKAQQRANAFEWRRPRRRDRQRPLVERLGTFDVTDEQEQRVRSGERRRGEQPRIVDVVGGGVGPVQFARAARSWSPRRTSGQTRWKCNQPNWPGEPFASPSARSSTRTEPVRSPVASATAPSASAHFNVSAESPCRSARSNART